MSCLGEEGILGTEETGWKGNPPPALAPASSHRSRGNSEGEGYSVEGKDNVDVWMRGEVEREGRDRVGWCFIERCQGCILTSVLGIDLREVDTLR